MSGEELDQKITVEELHNAIRDSVYVEILYNLCELGLVKMEEKKLVLGDYFICKECQNKLESRNGDNNNKELTEQ